MSTYLENIVNGAVGKNELLEYMIGKGEYSFVNPYSDMPTDTSKALKALEDYFCKSQERWDLFLEKVIELSENPEYGWLSIYYIYDLIGTIRRQKLNMDLMKVAHGVETNLIKSKDQLIENKQWAGAGFETGLWGDVQRMAKIINEGLKSNLFTSLIA